jgi:hypothetical protein
MDERKTGGKDICPAAHISSEELEIFGPLIRALAQMAANDLARERLNNPTPPRPPRRNGRTRHQGSTTDPNSLT